MVKFESNKKEKKNFTIGSISVTCQMYVDDAVIFFCAHET